MKNKVKIVDYYGVKSFHEVFNTALAIMCSHIFNEVKYKAGRSSCEIIKKSFNAHKKNDSIHFLPRPVCEMDTNLGAFIRTIWGGFVTIKEYLFSKRNTVLIFNYTNPLSMPIILILNYLLRKKVIFVMHGELELQLKQNILIFKPAFWYRLFHRVCLKYFFNGNRAIILVLGDSIKNNLSKLFPSITPNVCSMWHPYFIEDYAIKERQNVLTIGTIGVMKKEKGLDSFIRLSEELDNLIREKKLILKSIGKIEDAIVVNSNNIQWIGSKGLMPRKEFEDALQTLDYILYLYPSDSYKLTASGAIMDAIKFRKPIIALHNDYFDSLLKDVCIGYVVNDIPEMVSVINKLVVTEGINDFCKGFGEVRKRISIEYNSVLFEHMLRERQYI